MPIADRERFLANDRKLGGLQPPVRNRFESVVKRLESLGWAPLVMETVRSAARQLVLRAMGRSWVKRSKHQDGLAMDIISSYHPWPKTPLKFMADLALAAREEGLATGIAWGHDPVPKALIENSIRHGDGPTLTRLLVTYGHGDDPCHCEVKDG